MNFELKTVAILPEGCFSVLLCNGKPFAVTLEHTFADGKPIIKKGIYQCDYTKFIRGNYFTYEVIIRDHTRILFHKGNTEADSQGCVLVGESFAEFNQKTGIANSAGGFAEFMKLAGGIKYFGLTVSGR